ncbi:hypothetical protein ABK040_010041 [Willaertia magna]
MGNAARSSSNWQVENVDEMIENGSLNSYLATLPKLFTEATTSKGEKYLCSGYITSNFKSVIFACTDINKNFFMKKVSRKKLAEIRDKLDVNKTINWWSFFTALRQSFISNKVNLKINNNECLLNIDLNFPQLGKTGLSLPLRKVEENPMEHFIPVFAQPLYEFYNIRTEITSNEKTEQLEKQIKLYKDKIAELEKEIKERFPNASMADDDDDAEEVEAEAEHKLEQPKEQPKQPEVGKKEVEKKEIEEKEVGKKEEAEKEIIDVTPERATEFLNEVMSKLISNNSITQKEKQSFDKVIEVLSKDSQFNSHFEKELYTQADMPALQWLKVKFTKADKPVTINVEGVSPTQFMSREEAKQFLEQHNVPLTGPRNEMLELYEKLDEWNFDVFSVHRITGGNPLFCTCFTLFQKYDFLNRFNIKEEILINFLRELEAGYHPNPYHNATHASDVLQATHYIISQGGLIEMLSDEDCLAALISATVHDYDHPGLNNAFLMSTRSYLATLYNDRAVLENHHCSQSFELMRQDKFNILGGLSPEQRRDVRETIIEMLLATDMGQHAKIVAKFKGRVEANADFKNQKEDLRLALQITIKMADVSNPARPLGVALKWTECINNEFFAQGDKERDFGLSVSPLMDRNTLSVGKGQVAFINYLVEPMFVTFFKIAPKMSFCKKYYDNNRLYWSAHAFSNREDYDKLWWDPPAEEKTE